MSYPYTPTPTALPGSITLPQDDDPPDAADTSGPDEIAFDAIANLEQYVIPGADLDRTTSHFSAAESQWTFVSNGNRAQVNEEPGGESIVIHCDLPHSSIWIGGAVTIKPVTVARAALPSVKPSLSAWKKRITTGVVTSVAGAVNDPSADVAAYEATHDIGISSFTETVNRELYTYFLLLSGEGDGGGVNYTQYLQLVVGTTTAIVNGSDPGAA